MWSKFNDYHAIVLTSICVISPGQVCARPVASDIRLRVLIEQIKPSEIFAASSPKLFLGSDDQVTSDSISCEFSSSLSGLTIWKNPMSEDSQWYCRAGDQRAKITKNLHVHSQTGILSIGSESYRGHIELLATKKSLYVINHIPLDAYLASLANSEMSSGFPEAAMIAQIIAARSYALSTAVDRRKKMWSFDLYNTQVDQVYKGVRFETEKSWRLSKSTARKVLNFSGSVLKAYYHSSSGGHLELPLNVWGGDPTKEAGAYRAKPNPYDKALAGDAWQIKLSRDLGSQIKASGPIHEIKILDRTEGRRVKRLQIIGTKGKAYLSGVQFRNLFGPGWIKSALFDVKKQGTSFLIEGRGWGHGVGMSQWGAKVMAESGKSAEQILKFYYPGAHVSVYGRKPASSGNVSDSRAPAAVSAR